MDRHFRAEVLSKIQLLCSCLFTEVLDWTTVPTITGELALPRSRLSLTLGKLSAVVLFTKPNGLHALNCDADAF